MNERISVQDKCLLVCLLQPSFLWNIHHLPLCLPRPKSKQILSYKHWGRTLRATVTSFPDKEKIASAGAQLFLLLLCASLVLHRLHSQAFPCPSVVLCGFPHIYLLADIYISIYRSAWSRTASAGRDAISVPSGSEGRRWGVCSRV